MNTRTIRTYSELSEISDYKERFNYLKLDGSVGIESFGFDRYLNQIFYRSPEWRRIRDKVIIRDDACDMGLKDWPINGNVLIHHMNPINDKDILERNPDIFNPEFLVCVSHSTHNAIHYGSIDLLQSIPNERAPGDTCPWR